MTEARPIFLGLTKRAAYSARAGFTLIELLAVMAIIALLASLLMSISAYATHNGRVTRAKADIEQFRDAIEEYRLAYGCYPNLLSKATNGLPPTVDMIDPWKRTYVYVFNTNHPGTYALYSKGKSDTLDKDDIYSGKQ